MLMSKFFKTFLLGITMIQGSNLFSENKVINDVNFVNLKTTYSSAVWEKQKFPKPDSDNEYEKIIYYRNEKYRVSFYLDVAYDGEEERTLFTATPIYHNGVETSYKIEFSENLSTDISTSLGVSLSSEVTAFGNGIKYELGITATITNSYSISSSDSYTLNLSAKDAKGYYVVYGYNHYLHYKFEVKKYVTKTVTEQVCHKEGKKESCHNEESHYEVLEDCPIYSREFVVYNPKKYENDNASNKLIYNYKYLGTELD